MIKQGEPYPQIAKEIAYSTKPRILQNIPELKRIIKSNSYMKTRLKYYRIIRKHIDIESLLERQLYWLGDTEFDSLDKILANPNYGHRVEKGLYGYFISSIDRLNMLHKLSYEYEDMLYILNRLYLSVYLYTCTDEWNKSLDNYNEAMNIELNVLFPEQISLLEHIGNTDTRIQEHVTEQLLLTNEYDRRIRDFDKKYIHDALAVISRFSSIMDKLGG